MVSDDGYNIHNNLNVLNATDLYTLKWLKFKFYVTNILPQEKKIKNKEPTAFLLLFEAYQSQLRLWRLS